MAIDNKKMLNLLLKKILENIYAKKISEFLVEKLKKYSKKINLPDKYIIHLHNVSILIASYTAVSAIIYPEFRLSIFAKEVFSLLCAYGAIFLWFIEKITMNIRYKVVVGVTACTAPIFFINNAFSVAVLGIILIIFIEFLLFEYIRGCNLFSDLIPVYVICEDISQIAFINNFIYKYKILELIFIADDEQPRDALENFELSELKSLEDIRKKLSRINKISFFPMPRRIMYFPKQKTNLNVIMQLLSLSSDFSIPIFKINSEGCESLNSTPHLNISPICFQDFESVNIKQQEKAALTAVFKNKRVWASYDGRQSVIDLIRAICTVSSVDLTILCESEKLSHEISNELSNRNTHKNYKIKIIDANLLSVQEVKPDILFYNIPIKSASSSEDNLKEALIRNVLDTARLIEFAQSSKIKFVFLMSSMEAVNANNWIGATQRLGELITQYADSRCKKMYTKFRVVRIPECATDIFGVFGDIISSLLLNGYINFNFSDLKPMKMYYRDDIIHPLIKLVTFSLKEHDFSSGAYSIVPKNTVTLDDLTNIVCNSFGLKKNGDIKVLHTQKPETMDLEEFPNIVSEQLDHTHMDSIMITHFHRINLEAYESPMWSLEEVNEMKTRDLISSVFQNLNEKIKR